MAASPPSKLVRNKVEKLLSSYGTRDLDIAAICPLQLQAFFINLGRSLGAHPLISFFSALGAFSNLMDTARVNITDQWTYNTGLWLMAIAPKGASKSPSIRVVTDAVECVENREHMKKLNLEAGGDDVKEPPKIASQRMVKNATIEGLGLVLQSNDSSSAVIVTDELSQLVAQFKKGSSGKDSEYGDSGSLFRNTLIQLYDGDHYRTNLKGEGLRETKKRPTVSIVAASQPGVVVSELSKPDFPGFWDRWVFAFPPLVFTKFDEKIRPKDADCEDFNLVAMASNIKMKHQDEVVYVLCDEAKAVLSELHDKLLDEFEHNVMNQSCQDMAGASKKAFGNVVKVAAVLQAMTDLTEEEKKSPEISSALSDKVTISENSMILAQTLIMEVSLPTFLMMKKTEDVGETFLEGISQLDYPDERTVDAESFLLRHSHKLYRLNFLYKPDSEVDGGIAVCTIKRRNLFPVVFEDKDRNLNCWLKLLEVYGFGKRVTRKGNNHKMVALWIPSKNLSEIDVGLMGFYKKMDLAIKLNVKDAIPLFRLTDAETANLETIQ